MQCGVRDLKALPKAHLHIHLEGAMRPETLTDLCKRHGIERPADTRGRRFADFSAFVATYIAACECLREPSDLKRLVLEVAEDARAHGASWMELALSLHAYKHTCRPWKCPTHYVEGTFSAIRVAEAATRT